MRRHILEAAMGILMLVAVATNVSYTLKKDLVVVRSEDVKTVVIDAGHGGKDPGKTREDVLEKDINLDIANILREKLEAAGYQVIMTRTEDMGLYQETDSNKKATDMRSRCELINSSGADLAISIHQNSYTDNSVNGAQVFYYRHSQEGEKLANMVQASLKKNVNENNTRQAKYNDSYYLLINTACPTVIVECGFLSNENEAKLLQQREYQEKLAMAISLGIDEYFGR